jgi:cytochrome c oxidase assembly factor CtaG
MASVTFQVLEGLEIRVKALLLLIGGISGSLTALTASTYPPDQYPIVKFACFILGALGLICAVWQSNSKPVLKEVPKSTE